MPYAPLFTLALLGLGLLTPATVQARAPQTAAPNTQALAGADRFGLQTLPCSSFTWNDNHDVIRVPISLAGKQYTYQLDTGADVVIPYGKGVHPRWAEKYEGVRIPQVTFAGMHLPAIVAYRMPSIPDTSLGGTVGLDLLVGHVFVIDFPQRRICLFNKADIPDRLNQAADWTPAELRHGKLFLTLSYNGLPLPDIFYDSGSSPSALSTDLATWQQLTGRHGEADASSKGSFLAWGKPSFAISAPASGTLQLGSLAFPHPTVDTQPRRPNLFRDQYQAQGLLGNAFFLNDIVILDLGAHPQFGLISPAAPSLTPRETAPASKPPAPPR